MAYVTIKVQQANDGYEAVVDGETAYPGASPDEALGHAVREMVLTLGSTFGVVITLREE